MKRKPTLKQKKIIKKQGLDPKNYLIIKEEIDNLKIIKRKTEKIHNIRY